MHLVRSMLVLQQVAAISGQPVHSVIRALVASYRAHMERQTLLIAAIPSRTLQSRHSIRSRCDRPDRYHPPYLDHIRPTFWTTKQGIH
uniref:Putative secreted protein n=1 Tax=Anopheles marajoara TaxID=58244 RepID=A0A2M4CAV8_9DIPT